MLKRSHVPKRLLLGGAPVLLWAWEGEGGDRFVALFEHVWTRLPPAATDRLLRHWQPPIREGHWVIDGPARLQGRLARTCRAGRHLEFSASAVEEMPDTLVAALIAHELARALLCSQDDDARRPKDDVGRQARGDLVDGLTRTWGFGPDSVREWAVAHGAVLD